MHGTLAGGNTLKHVFTKPAERLRCWLYVRLL
jgi:hypothetical protein